MGEISGSSGVASGSSPHTGDTPQTRCPMTKPKRLFDLAVSTVALAALAPAFAVIAVAIRLEDGGPALFRQKRIGPGGEPFEVMKFRKFSQRANGTGSIVTLTDDDRYSRVGRFLERTKLNELPQLLNVLRGEMSIVGPRPEILAFRHCFTGAYANLLSFQPGIFGPSQSEFRDEASMYPAGLEPTVFYERVLFPRKADIDLAYYPTATLRSDLYWILRSLGAVIGVIRPEGSGMLAVARASSAASAAPVRAPHQR